MTETEGKEIVNCAWWLCWLAFGLCLCAGLIAAAVVLLAQGG